MTNIQLHYFYYGPFHNTVVTTTELIKTPRPGILEYRWTPSLLTGSDSGRQARVWLHQSVESGVLEALTQ